MIQPLWKTIQRFLKKLEIKPPYDPAIPLLGIYPEETEIEKDTCIIQCRNARDQELLRSTKQNILA